MQETLKDEQKKLLILALVGIAFSISLAAVLNRSPSTLYRSDMYLRWYAIEKLFSENRNLYDSRNGEEVTKYVWGEEALPRNANFYYPAHLIVLIGPLALLPYPLAHLIWTTGVQILFLVGVWLAMQLAGWPDSINKQTAVTVAATLWLPHLQHTMFGQFNSIGVLSLVLCFLALRSGQYGLAGGWAIGLTFKPHVTVLPLVLLLIWALLKRERWRFYLGFALSGLAMWLITEFLQPGWLLDFWAALRGYGAVESVVDLIWNPHQVVAIVLCLVALVVFGLNGRRSATGPVFAGCLSFSVAVWFLVVPVLGMFHTVLLPVVVVLLVASLKQSYRALYPYALYGIVLIYVLGMVGFLWGLSSPELYGKYNYWSELAYKVAAPIFIGLFSIPLCFRTTREVVRPAL